MKKIIFLLLIAGIAYAQTPVSSRTPNLKLKLYPSGARGIADSLNDDKNIIDTFWKKNSDSLTAHLGRLNNLDDSIAAHLGRLNAIDDSITAHLGRLNAIDDSITAHSTVFAKLSSANSWTNTNTFDTTTVLNGIATPSNQVSSITGSTIDVAGKSFVKFLLSADTNLNLMTGGVDGQRVVLLNLDPDYDPTIVHASVGNGFLLSGGVNNTLDGGESIEVMYVASEGQWIQINTTAVIP